MADNSPSRECLRSEEVMSPFSKQIGRKRLMKRLVVLAVCGLFLSSGVLAQRLPENAVPDSYDLKFVPDLAGASLTGDEPLHVHFPKTTPPNPLTPSQTEFTEAPI